VKQKRQTRYYNIISIIDEMMPEPNQFWNNAHRYVFTTGEEQFVSEVAYIMTTLHEEGYDN